jgi:hypothetical protein
MIQLEDKKVNEKTKVFYSGENVVKKGNRIFA